MLEVIESIKGSTPLLLTFIIILVAITAAIVFAIINVILLIKKKGIDVKGVKVDGEDSVKVDVPVGKVTISIQTFRQLLDACDLIYDKFIRTQDDIKKLIVMQQIRSFNLCLADAIDNLSLSLLDKESVLKNLPADEGSLLLRLFIERDFNSILEQNIQDYKDFELQDKTASELSIIVQELSSRCVKALKRRFNDYPTFFFDREILIELFKIQEPSIKELVQKLIQDYSLEAREGKTRMDAALKERQDNISRQIELIKQQHNLKD